MGSSQSMLSWDPFPDGRKSLRMIEGGGGGGGRRGLAAASETSASTSNSSLASNASGTGGTLPSSASNTVLMGSDAPALYEHALVGDWEALVRRVATHSKEARYVDKCKNTPLHVACRRQPPPEVVQALIRAYPSAIDSKTMDGLTPLHFACYCGSEVPTVQQVLGQNTNNNNNNNSSITLRDMVDRRGRTPLHCVCAGFRSPHRLEVIRLLLTLDPSCAVAADEKGRTPLSLIIDDYAEELQDALQVTAVAALESCTTPGGDLYECWNAMCLLLRAAYRGTLQDDEWTKNTTKTKTTGGYSNEVHVDGQFQVLHAAVGVAACPVVFVRLLLKVDPDAVRNVDSDLNLPLHIAARTCRLLCAMGDASCGRGWWTKPTPTSSTTTTTSSTATTILRSSHSFSGIGATAVSVYNADFGRCDPIRKSMSKLPSVTENSTGSSLLGYPHVDEVIKDLLQPYPEAASIPDEFGKLPFVLAMESGKSWKTALEPLWNAYPHILDSFEDDTTEPNLESIQSLQQVVDGALTSVSSFLRQETTKTLRYFATLWPKQHVNDWVVHMIEFSKDCGGLMMNKASCKQGDVDVDDDDDEWGATLQASALEGLASVLGHIPPNTLTIPDTAQLALDVALSFLANKNESVRIGAANVLGAGLSLLGSETSDRALREIVFQTPDENDDGSISTMGHSASSSIDEDAPVEVVHGRAVACHAILQSQSRTLTEAQSHCVKESWMKHDHAIVRKAACLVVGTLLSSSNDLKEFRSSILKCMRTTEDMEVHMALAHGLSHAAKRHPNLFLCKTGLPLLDAALMLSLTATVPSVQHAFHVFLWYALQMGDENGQEALQSYMKLAEGGNGRIMMSLVTKTLAKLEVDENE